MSGLGLLARLTLMHFLTIATRIPTLLIALLATGCAATPWQGDLTASECDQVEQELYGFGTTRQEALNDAIHTAITNEFGAFVSSELVLEGSELIVNRRGQATRGMVDSAIAIGKPETVADSSEIKLLTRVTLCRNTIRPRSQTPPSAIPADRQMHVRTQAMLDVSDSQNSALLNRRADFQASVSALLNPVAGPALHRAEVTSYQSTNVIPATHHNRSTARRNDDYLNTRVSFEIIARVFIEPETRLRLEQILNDVALDTHTLRFFGAGYTALLQRQGFATFDQRLEQASNPALHPSDHHGVSQARNSLSPEIQATDITILRGLAETRSDDAEILRHQVAAAIQSFYERGLSIVGWSAEDRPVLKIPLFQSITGSHGRIEKIALYPESSKGRINRSNGAVFQWPTQPEQTWLALQATPLRLLQSEHARGSIPALRRGGSQLEIVLSVNRAVSTRVTRFTLEPTRSTGLSGNAGVAE